MEGREEGGGPQGRRGGSGGREAAPCACERRGACEIRGACDIRGVCGCLAGPD